MAEKSSTKTSTRIGILVGAFVFLLSSVTTAVFVIIDSVNKKDTNTSATTEPESQTKKKLDGFTPVESVTALSKVDTKVGDGAEVKLGDKVSVLYTGALAKNGEIFESTDESGQPAEFDLVEGRLIKGWTEGIPGMKVGGTRQLVIPADQAYGATGQGDIGPNEALVFNVTILSATE